MSSRRSWVRLAAVGAALTLGLGVAAASPAGAATPKADPPPYLLTDLFDAVGSSNIGSINSTLPIGPTTLTETLNLNNADPNVYPIVTGSLPVPSKQIQFKALGIVPIRATVSLVETSPVTGTISSDPNTGNLSVVSHVSYTIKLSDVSAQALGVWIPLGIGSSCQTINPVAITASTPAGQSFDVVTGGNLTGKYTIGLFQNCAPLHLPDIFGLGSITINALVPGTNNTINLQLSNGRFAG